MRDVFVPCMEARYLVVGFALPFDLSRLAAAWSETRRPRRNRVGGRLPPRRWPWDPFTGGFSLKLTSQEGEGHLPRVAVKTIDSKRHLIALKGTGDEPLAGGSRAGFRGHFLDLRTLAFALTNTGHSLASAGRAFGTAHQKLDHQPTGRVTPEEVTYARGDVLATYDLAERLLEEYARHPVSPDHDPAARSAEPLQATKAYSPASVGKAYLRAMGVAPPLRRPGWDVPEDLLGWAMTAFYGGRAECRIRRTTVPVTYVDFTSMYTTVNGLMRLWDVLTAENLGMEDSTDDARALLAGVTVDGAFDPALWPRLRGFALVCPAGDVLPTRGRYGGRDAGWQIGINPLTSETPLWYAMPDLVAATLLTGRPPEVVQAVRLAPSGRLADLRPVALRGEVRVDPRRADFFAAVVEQRAAVRAGGGDESVSDFLKVLANAASYGIYAEMIRHPLPGAETMPVRVRGLGRPRTASVGSPEEPGEYAFPPIAALITAAARLMLALLERCVTDAGGTFAMVDTDSMAIVSDEIGSLVACPGGEQRTADGTAAVRALSWASVEEIRRRCDALNPYRHDLVADVLRLEDHNFASAPTPDNPGAVDRSSRVQLHAFAISAKRYALLNRDGRDIAVRKPSEHGLGHLLNPDDPDDRTERRWIAELWRSMALEAEGRPTAGPSFGHRPAVSRTTVSAPALLRPFEAYNRARPWTDRVRPFNFVLSATVARLGHPPGADPARFHLVARYERDPDRWLRMRWVDRDGLRSYAVATGPTGGDTVRLKSIDDVLAEYATHPERKSLGPAGRVVDRRTVGLLRRRPVTAASITYIGKEANELEEVALGLVHELDEVVTDYGRDEEPWTADVVPAIRLIPTAALAGPHASLRTVQRAVAGSARPQARAAEAIAAAAENHARAWLAAHGRPVPRRRRTVLRAFVVARAEADG